MAGKSGEELREMLNAETKAGKFQVDASSVAYFLTVPFRKAAIPLVVVYLANAAAESTGLSTEVSHFRP